MSLILATLRVHTKKHMQTYTREKSVVFVFFLHSEEKSWALTSKQLDYN